MAFFALNSIRNPRPAGSELEPEARAIDPLTIDRARV
jgi:hypothetical protein